MEHVIHVSAVRGARLVEGTRELLRERLALGGLHGPHGLLEVDLVGHEDDGDVLGGPHLRDQAPVLHGLVETVSAKIPSVTRGSSSIFNLQYKGQLKRFPVIKMSPIISASMTC